MFFLILLTWSITSIGFEYWANFAYTHHRAHLDLLLSVWKGSRSWPILPIFIRFVGIQFYSNLTVFSTPLGPACCLFFLVLTTCVLFFIFSAWRRLPILFIFLKDQPLVLFTFFAFNFIDIFVLVIILLTITNEFSYAYFEFKFLFFLIISQVDYWYFDLSYLFNVCIQCFGFPLSTVYVY